MRAALMLCAAAIGALFGQPAAAQYDRRAPVYRDPPPYATPYGRAYCQKLCALDMTPCDPPEFKRADGRCTNPVGGGRF
jgi:hypothetical protein